MRKHLLLQLTAIVCVLFAGSSLALAEKYPSAKGLQQTWSVNTTDFDIENNQAVCYLLDSSSSDGFAHEEDSSYVFMSVKQYCEQFAKDWNADPNNPQITAKEAAERTVTGDYFVRFTITEDQFLMTYGYLQYTVTEVDGKYTYDEETGTITVDDEIEQKKKEFKVYIDKDKNELVFYNFTEWYPLPMMSYDQTKDYYIVAPTYYYCGEYKESETSVSRINTDINEIARYSVTGTRLSAPQKGINIVKMNDGSTRTVVVK